MSLPIVVIEYVYNQPYFARKSVIENLKKSLLLKDQSNWQSQCRNLPKLRTFLKFKDFQVDSPHIYKPLSFIQRKYLSKYRLGMLQLRIEVGRFQRPRLEPEDRICQVCDSGGVEDETHFLLHCSLYDESRRRLYGYINDLDSFMIEEDSDKLKFLLNDSTLVKQTAKFIADSFDLRSTKL